MVQDVFSQKARDIRSNRILSGKICDTIASQMSKLIKGEEVPVPGTGYRISLIDYAPSKKIRRPNP